MTTTISGLARDASLVLTGASQMAIPKNGNRQFLEIENNTGGPVGVNYTGGVALIGGTGTITLVVGSSSMRFDRYVPQNPINVVGPVGTLLTVIEG